MAFSYTALEPPKFSIDVNAGRVQGTRVLWVPSTEELDTAVEELAGIAYDAGGQVVSAVPATWPGKPFLVLQNIEVEGFGDNEAFGGTDDAGEAVAALDDFGLEQPKNGYKLTLTYATPQFDTGNGIELPQEDLPEIPVETFLTVNRDISASLLALDVDGLKWGVANADGSDSIPESTSIGYTVPQITYVLKWSRVINPPFTAINELVGTINAESFLGHVASAVMFVGCRDQRQFQTDGSRQWELEYLFEVKEIKFVAPNGDNKTARWDWFFRADPSDAGQGTPTSDYAWQQIITKSNNQIFQSTDFGRLFQPEPDTP